VDEDVPRTIVLADRQLERLAGLPIVNGDRQVAVGRVPEETYVDAIAHAAVELPRFRRRRVMERIRVGRALILDVWIDHSPAPLLLSDPLAIRTNETSPFRLRTRIFLIALLT